MTQTCETCGRSWGDRAMFCGACGALLNRPLPSRGGPDDAGARPWWRRPFVGGGLAAIALVGLVAAVPTLSIQRTDPIEDTAIDMPEPDDLQGAPAGTRPRRSVEPPDVSCTAAEVEVDCVAWSRGLVPAMDTSGDGGQTWPIPFGDHLVLASEGELEAADAVTGTRLWRREVEPGLHPAGATDDLLVLLGTGTTVVDLATGETLWSVSTFGRHVHGDIVHDDVIYTGTERGDDEWGIAARDPRDGQSRWTWATDWSDLLVRRLDGGRLLASSGGNGVAVLDASTGNQLSRAEDGSEGWFLDLVDDTLVRVVPPDQDPSEPNRAGDPGAVLTGTDIVDGTVRWQRDVRSSDGWFQVIGDMVLAPSSRHLTAIDAATGEIAWEIETSGREHVAEHRLFGPWAAPTGLDAATPDLLVAVEQGGRTLRGRDLQSGQVTWERELQAVPWHAVSQGDVTLVYTNTGLHVLATATGQERLHVDGHDLEAVSTDPFILFHPVSGYVVRLDVPPEVAP